MASELHPAIWEGPFDAELPSGNVARGEQAMVTDRDLESTHWRAVDEKPKPTVTFPPVSTPPAEGADS